MHTEVRSNAVFVWRVWRARSRGTQVLIALAVLALGIGALLVITSVL